MLVIKCILFISFLILSGIIIFQDFKERLVSLWALTAFGMVCLSATVFFRDVTDLLLNFISVSVYLLLLWGGLKLYLFIKHKKSIQIIGTQIGLADVLVILFIGLTLNPIGQVILFCAGFVFSLLAFVIYSTVIKKNGYNTIPLAGLLVFFHFSAILILKMTSVYYIDCSFVNV